MRRTLPALRAHLLALLLVPVLACAAAALPAALSAQRSLAVQSFSVDLDVRSDGSLRVTETIRYAFTGSWNGVFREIPVRYRTPYGFDKRMYLEDVSITDADGAELWFEDSRPRHYRRFKVRVPGASNAVRTVVFAYTMRNALLHFEEHDELYWNVTGDESEVPIAVAEATVRLPEGAAGLRATAFTGAYGSTRRDVAVEELEDGFYFRTTEPLGFREGLTVVVGWDPGVVDRPSLADEVMLFLRANWPLTLPLLSFLAMWRIWSVRGRDPERRSVEPRYEPPEGMTPSEVGTLVDNSPGMRDLTADLVDLAVKGYLEIEEIEKGGLATLFGMKDYRLTLKVPKEAWELPEHQERLLKGIFGVVAPAGDTELVSELSGEFYTHLPDIRDRIYGRLIRDGHYGTRPDKVQKAWMGGGLMVGVGLVVLGLVLGPRVGVAPVTAVLTGLLTALPVLVIGAFMPARTIRGTRTLEDILGFQEFLERVESDRFRRMITGPEMFERFLPYAMALGVEKRWAKAFDAMGAQPPSWYRGTGTGGFHPNAFASDMGGLSTRAGSAMQTAPRSSGGSGFSGGGGGGGFSGGGGGGGSTGGW